MSAAAVTVRAPAKVNLFLAVGARRRDGYHALHTVYQAVSLYDRLTAVPAPRLTVAVSGEGAGALPPGETNLAGRAARLLADRFGVAAAVRLEIDKRIPVAAGLAGGSADAAAALVACGALWGLPVDTATLVELAASLGSDVPFSVQGGTALGTGRGERLTPVLTTGAFHWVLAFADTELATPAVYAELDRLRAPGAAAGGAERPATAEPPVTAGRSVAVERPLPAESPGEAPDPLLAALRSGDPVGLAGQLRNELEPAALRLRPELRRTLAAGHDAGALAGVVSGSGPTCAFLVKGPVDAAKVAARLAGAGVTRAVRVAAGPVAGARLVTGEEAEA